MSFKLLVPVDIVMDSREFSKNPDVKNMLEKNGIKVAVTKLEIGDYLLLASGKAKPILIERKSIMDLAQSIRDRRLWDQAKLLINHCDENGYQPLIIVEGDISLLRKYSNWSIQSILRAIDTVILDFKIPVLNTPDKESTVQWLIVKARSLGETSEKRIYRLRVEKKPLSIHDRILYVAESLSGPILARRLLKKFKTLRNIANASILELTSVEGVGEARAREIYEIFNTEWCGD
ncbi:MAG: ERCC4 domain-containing protein [Desulfurococcaceae archaeon]